MTPDLYKRLIKLESAALMQKSEHIETLEHAYEKACEFQDNILAAEMARKIRNKLLDESDRQMTIDRMNLDLSSTESFIDSLSSCLNTNWALYRQELRDLPSQEGFPFNIVFPVRPDEVEKNN